MNPNVPASTHKGAPGAVLRRFVEPRASVERCELCSTELAAEHQHLVEVQTRQLLCACDACALLFGHQAEAKYRRVPRRARPLPDFRLSDAAWNGLEIPIGLAFLLHSTPAERVVAVYPSPAGPTESLLRLEAWEDIVRENSVVADMEPDVEALLINRVHPAREFYLAPIDQCYKLVGLVRKHWRGLSGGSELWHEIERFFASMRGR